MVLSCIVVLRSQLAQPPAVHQRQLQYLTVGGQFLMCGLQLPPGQLGMSACPHSYGYPDVEDMLLHGRTT